MSVKHHRHIYTVTIRQSGGEHRLRVVASSEGHAKHLACRGVGLESVPAGVTAERGPAVLAAEGVFRRHAKAKRIANERRMRAWRKRKSVAA